MNYKRFFRQFFNKNLSYIILMILLFIVGLILKYFFYDQILLIDESIFECINKVFINDTNTIIMKVITEFGGAFILMILIVAFYLFLKDKKISIHIGYSLIVTYLFNFILKNIYRRERPEFTLIPKPDRYSFPSSHAMCSIVFYGLIIYYTLKNVKNKALKYITIILLMLLIMAIGLSRVYLRVHYFSDVLFGYLFGLILLSMLIDSIDMLEGAKE